MCPLMNTALESMSVELPSDAFSLCVNKRSLPCQEIVGAGDATFHSPIPMNNTVPHTDFQMIEDCYKDQPRSDR